MPIAHTNALAQLRKGARVTQDQVAGALGVSKATYSAWETGRVELGAERIVALARYFQCTPNDILCFENPESRYTIISAHEEKVVDLYRLSPPNIKDDVVDIMRSSTKGWRVK